MVVFRRVLSALILGAALVGPQARVSAQAQPTTELTISGGLNESISGSDENACVLDDDSSFRAQLASSNSTAIMSFEVPGANTGTVPIGQPGGPKLTLLSFSDDPNELLVNW
jgi:hypothetical protein